MNLVHLTIALPVLLCIHCVGGTQLIEGLYCGLDNCYDILEVTREATKADLSKSYRQLAKKWHPDRHKSDEDKEAASEVFRKIATAYEILKEEDSRKDYDYMLDHPDEFYTNYYRYYRRRVAPKVDYRIVIVVFISIVSLVQYYGAWNNYKCAIDYFATVQKYRIQALEIAKNEGLLLDKKKKDRTKTKEELKEEEEAIIKMIIEEKMDIRGGYKRPSLTDILWLQLVMFPYHVATYILWYVKWFVKYAIRREEYDNEAKQYLVRRNLRISQGQWDALEDKVTEEYMKEELWNKDKFKEWKQEKEEEMKALRASSAQHKRIRRYLKKGGPGQMTFGPD